VSCDPGTYVRAINHLDKLHPDVVIEVATTASTDEEVRVEISKIHDLIFMPFYNTLNDETKANLKKYAEEYNSEQLMAMPAYTTYLEALKVQSKPMMPLVSSERIAQITDVNMLMPMIDGVLGYL
jgi:hypothetical protein